MLIVIGLMVCGILIGFRFRKRNLKFISPLIPVAIWVLLFLLGLNVGGDPKIMNNLGTIGGEALWLTLGAVGGSVLCAWGVYRFFFCTDKDKL